jgi:hypothetical protein
LPGKILDQRMYKNLNIHKSKQAQIHFLDLQHHFMSVRGRKLSQGAQLNHLTLARGEEPGLGVWLQ